MALFFLDLHVLYVRILVVPLAEMVFSELLVTAAHIGTEVKPRFSKKVFSVLLLGEVVL